MRWCFTRFRHASRTARGGPKCVGASLELGCARLGRPRVRGSARTRLGAYATRRVRDSLLSFLVLDQDIVAARGRDAVWVARGGMAFFAVYILNLPQ